MWSIFRQVWWKKSILVETFTPLTAFLSIQKNRPGKHKKKLMTSFGLRVRGMVVWRRTTLKQSYREMKEAAVARLLWAPNRLSIFHKLRHEILTKQKHIKIIFTRNDRQEDGGYPDCNCKAAACPDIPLFHQPPTFALRCCQHSGHNIYRKKSHT